MSELTYAVLFYSYTFAYIVIGVCVSIVFIYGGFEDNRTPFWNRLCYNTVLIIVSIILVLPLWPLLAFVYLLFKEYR